MYRKAFAFLIAAALLAAAPLAAQTPISVGQTVSGSLDEGDPQLETGAFYDSYVIRGRPGERVLVRMRSEDFDTYLRWGFEAEDGVWDEVGSNDDGGDGTDSRLVVTLPSDGEYELRASAFGEEEGGAYELELSPAMAPRPGRVAIGETVQGELTDDDYEGDYGFEDHYVLRPGSRGQTVTLFAESDEFDTYITLGTDDRGTFQEISSDDDGGEGTNSQLVAELEGGTEYHVILRSFSGEDLGPYTLRVAEGAFEPEEEEWDMEFDTTMVDSAMWTDTVGVEYEEPEVVGSVVGPVSAGRDVQGELGGDAEDDGSTLWYHEYTYRARAGERLTIRVSSDEIDSYVMIGRGTGDAFEQIWEDDDSGEGLNAEMEFEAPEAGEYTIRVTSAYPQTGAYVLRVDREP
jgi:hypothetical protein